MSSRPMEQPQQATQQPPPPTKRQTKAKPSTPPPSEPKASRPIRRLDLSNNGIVADTEKPQLDSLLKTLRTKKKIVVIAGAGISVAAGVPDFRSSEGLFSTLRSGKVGGKDLFDASVYKDGRLTSMFHDMVRSLHEKTSTAVPTDFHKLLATLAEEGRLLRLYSQNVDCLDTRLEPLKTTVPLTPKGPWPKTVQLHGGLEMMNCSRCSYIGPIEPSKFQGATPPDCPECAEMDTVRSIAGKRCLGVGKLRPRIVLYNEFNPDADVIGQITSADLKARPDAVIVVGTSLKVPGVRRIVREMCGVTRDFRGGLTVWINECDPPVGREFTDSFDLIVKGDCQRLAELFETVVVKGESPQIAPAACATPSPCTTPSLSSELSTPPPSEDGETKCKFEVQIQVQQLPSPSTSPRPAPKKAPASRKRAAPETGAAPKKARKAPAKPRATAKATTAKTAPKKDGSVLTAFKTAKKTVATVVGKTKPKAPAAAPKTATIKPAPAKAAPPPVARIPIGSLLN